MNPRCRIEMLGGLRVEQVDRWITRFRTQKTGILLAYLAYFPSRVHPREVLAELLWSDDTPDAARASLRMALSSLRHQLEPPGVAAGAVIASDRFGIRLNADAVTTDVAEFESHLRIAAKLGNAPEGMSRLAGAVDLYRGPLLPGCYEEWLLPEQERLAGLYFDAVRRLAAVCAEAGILDRALDCAWRAVGIDPLREDAQCDLLRLLLTAGQPSAALRQYGELERLVQVELGRVPSPVARLLARKAELQLAGERTQPRVLRERLFHDVSTPLLAAKPSPARAHQGDLPLQLTRFFGRRQEIDQLLAMVGPEDGEARSAERVARDAVNPGALPAAQRLITLTGPGGSGKTRLAIEVAGRLRKQFGENVRFVGLVDLADPGLIAVKLGDVLALPRSPERDSVDQLTEALAGQPCLLVLDNFEHLLPHGARTVETLLTRLPLLRCLVTSRQRLGLPGEREYPVPPLPVPDESGEPRAPSAEALGQRFLPIDKPPSERLTPNSQCSPAPKSLVTCPSVQILIDRGQEARPDFQVTSHNAGAVASLCRQLEGIPLALELAAARLAVLTPQQIVERLGQRLDLLVSR